MSTQPWPDLKPHCDSGKHAHAANTCNLCLIILAKIFPPRTGEVLVYRIWVLSDLVLSQPVGCSSHCSSKERWSIKTLWRLLANCETGAGCWRVSSTYSSRIFSTLAGGKIFSKLDLSQAYLQVPVDESSKPYLTVNAHAPRTYWNPWEVIPPMPVKSVQSCYSTTSPLVMAGCPMEVHPHWFCWSILGHMFFVTIDAHSKWP